MAKGVLAMNDTNEISLEEKVDLLTNLVQTAFYGSLAIYGERLQYLAHTGVRPYDWWTGHLSDFCALAACISFFNSGLSSSPFFPKNEEDHSKYNAKELESSKLIIAALMPALYTTYELLDIAFSKFIPGGDWQDIACFWGGAATAYFTPKLAKSAAKGIKKLFSKPEPTNKTKEVFA